MDSIEKGRVEPEQDAPGKICRAAGFLEIRSQERRAARLVRCAPGEEERPCEWRMRASVEWVFSVLKRCLGARCGIIAASGSIINDRLRGYRRKYQDLQSIYERFSQRLGFFAHGYTQPKDPR